MEHNGVTTKSFKWYISAMVYIGVFCGKVQLRDPAQSDVLLTFYYYFKTMNELMFNDTSAQK